MNPKESKAFKKAITEILLGNGKRAQYQNKKPTQQELKTHWKLV